MPNELKPCPFCGSNNLQSREGLEWSDVRCKTCLQSVSSFPCAAENVWNTRPIEDALQARIEELEKQLANLRANSRTKLELDTCRSLNEALREENIRLIAENKKLKGDKDEATNLRSNQANQTRHPQRWDMG